MLLLAMGVKADKLRLVYAQARLSGAAGRSVAHMVVAYYPTAGAEPLILDNLIPGLKPASARPDLTPVFSFNTESLWQATADERVAADPVARLSRWREVLSKARAEGF
jgi:predicted transglutaminase-like cysteine proteinase